MSSSNKQHRPKSAKSHPPKCHSTYVVAFSLNETEDTMKAINDGKILDVTLTNSTVVSSARDPTNNTISSITPILNEIIDNISVKNDDDKIKPSVTDYAFDKTLEDIHQSNVLLNSNFGLGDISSSNTSTETIRNASNSSNLTICSNVGSLPTENSNITLKHHQKEDDDSLYSNVIIPLTSKCSIFSAKNNEQLEKGNKTAKNSSISYNTDENLTINVPSGIHIPVSKSFLKLDNVVTPYKTDCINVALVQMEKSPIVTRSKEKINCTDNYNVSENKSNSLILPKNIPNPATDYSKSYLSAMYNENENSETTLVGSVFSGFSSSNDERLHNIGSSINKTDDSMLSLTSRSQYYSSTDEKLEDSSEKPSPISNTIPTTSDVGYVIDTNHVIIADDMRKLYPLKSKGDGQQFMDKFTENLIKKTFDISENFQKNVNVTLPNESTIIQEILTQRENAQKLSCSEELRNFQPFPDMWDKISVTLDLAIKRLEESLSDKILNELKTTLHKIEHFANQISLQKPNESGDVDAIEKAESNNDEGMQCNIIQSYVIDNLMIRLSEEGQSERSTRTKILKVKHPKILPDTFEVLKAYSKPDSIPTGEGDSLRVSSGDSEISTQSRRRLLFHGPMRFFRENSVVLGSVPAFFVYMLVIYGFVMLVVKV
ncbi:uncharacterized protein LOC111000730 [Pieris rapae]|uniref:uncharacterized protein LOC111000730 n=1 Tax=Pieris rapae TaxID=64459 RepID=UPI001E27FFC0|nr:uncharacterized protein LOC111000730 [Pieris rapae]